MTIASEVTRIKTNIAQAYTALEEKGATIPEVKNSDNLAEAVQSVSAGGGSDNYEYRNGWLVPQLYRDLDTLVANYGSNTPNRIQCGSSTSAMGKDSTYIQGIVFTDNVNSIDVHHADSYIKYYVIPEDAIVEKGEDIDRYKITFKTDKWIIFDYCIDIAQPLSYGISRLNDYHDGNGGIYRSFIKYASIKSLKSSLSFTAPTAKGHFNLDDVHIIGEHTKKTKIDFSTIVSCKNLQNSLCLLDIFDIPSLEDTSDTWSEQTLQYIGYALASYHASKLLDYVKFPIILDLSEYTKTGTLTLGRNDSEGTCRLTHLKMVLPSTCSVALKAGNGTWENPILNIESYKFIAEHAPTVSGLTFTMGSIAKEYCNTVDTSIVTTLTNKGWTVA